MSDEFPVRESGIVAGVLIGISVLSSVTAQEQPEPEPWITCVRLDAGEHLIACTPIHGDMPLGEHEVTAENCERLACIRAVPGE